MIFQHRPHHHTYGKLMAITSLVPSRNQIPAIFELESTTVVLFWCFVAGCVFGFVFLVVFLASRNFYIPSTSIRGQI